MLCAIFSDIHSNLQAYESLINDLKKKKPDKCLCLGDIVGYGANPRECIGLTKKLDCPVICGNHDLLLQEKYQLSILMPPLKKQLIGQKACLMPLINLI